MVSGLQKEVLSLYRRWMKDLSYVTNDSYHGYLQCSSHGQHQTELCPPKIPSFYPILLPHKHLQSFSTEYQLCRAPAKKRKPTNWIIWGSWSQRLLGIWRNDNLEWQTQGIREAHHPKLRFSSICKISNGLYALWWYLEIGWWEWDSAFGFSLHYGHLWSN